MTPAGGDWFTEICDECGSAFSLRVRGKIHEEQTPFQRIEVYGTERYGNLLVIDGYVMLTARDHFVYHEMMAHPALFSHADPRRVVVVGGGDCGVLREVLRHPGVEQVTQVEIDERVTRVAERHFPELCEANDDARARFVFADAVAWMAEAPTGSADVVIIDSTDPEGAALALYSEAFYAQCLRVTGPAGVLVQQSESPLFHMDIIGPMHRRMRAAGYGETRSLNFTQTSYPTGWWTATVGGPAGWPEAFREADARAAELGTRYYSADMHRASLATPPFLAAQLAADG